MWLLLLPSPKKHQWLPPATMLLLHLGLLVIAALRPWLRDPAKICNMTNFAQRGVPVSTRSRSQAVLQYERFFSTDDFCGLGCHEHFAFLPIARVMICVM